MKNTRGKHGARAALGDAVGQVLQIANAARGDDRDRHRVRHLARQLQIKTGFRPVAIHAGEQELASAKLGHASRPSHDIDARAAAPAVGEDFPARPGMIRVNNAARVDGHDDAL